jgi:hypothetical protein
MSGQDVAKEYEQVIPFKLPSEDDWEEAACTLGLSKSGRTCLLDLLHEIHADVEMQRLYSNSHLTRDESIKKLKDIEKAAKALRAVLIENEKLLPDVIPHKALQNLGKLFDDSVISETFGRQLRPTAPSRKIQKLLKERGIAPTKRTKREKEEANRQVKSDAGLTCAGALLIRTLDMLINPIDEWHEERKRLSKGGRTKDRSRRGLIFELASHAEAIIGEKPSSDVKSKFFDLCELVFEICAVPRENLKNLIGEVLRESGQLGHPHTL